MERLALDTTGAVAAGLLWWERVDSDHRRHCQQIYSLSPLATRERSHMKLYDLGGEAAAEVSLELVNGVEPSTC